jgi:ATP sulfurylase
MKTLTCDVCRTAIESPVSNRNYFHMAHRDICESCHDKLEALVKPVVRTKQPFDYGWYTNLVQDSIEKAVQKGKF